MKRFAWLSVIAITSIACSSPGTGDVARDLGGDSADLSVAADLDTPVVPDLGATPDAAQSSLTTLSVLAGKVGGSGNADDVGTAARFNNPQGLAVDAAGNVYVADGNNHTIRKIVSATGAVTSLAGTTTSTSSIDGTGATARFRSPNGLLLDGGDLYVADGAGHAVRKVVLATGAVSTVAGTLNTPGSTDGTGTAARFNTPSALALDAGSLYVTDGTNNTIRRIVLATGAVTTLAGTAGMSGSIDGTGAAARFNGPAGIAADGAGNLYVADRANDTIRKLVVATGAVSTLAGTAGMRGSIDGTGAAARLRAPTGLTADKAGNLYFTEQFLGDLRKVEMATGVVTTPARGFVSAAVTADAAGALYITDGARQTLCKLVLPAGTVTDLAGGGVVRSSMDGTGTAAQFYVPFGVAADAAGTLYVSELYAVRKVTADGVVTTLAGGKDPGSADGIGAAAKFDQLRGLTSDATGALYAFDARNYTIRKIVPATGAVTRLAGQTGFSGTADGASTVAQFGSATGLAADTQGNLYVADTDNHTIRKVVAATGAVTTIAGQARQSGSTNGTGTAARFNRPYALATDGAGNLFIADSGNATIRKLVLATGEVTTPLGTAGMTGSTDGIGTAARFSMPSGLLVVGGTLYVSDKNGSTVRRVTLADLRVTTAFGIPGLRGVKPGALPARLNQPGALAALPDGTLAVIDEEENVLLRVR